MTSFAFSLAALLCLVPFALVSFTRRAGRDTAYWCATIIAVAGPVLWAVTANYRGWHTGFASTLWVIIAATMLFYAVLAGTARHAWRLGPILIPYLLLLALMATIWGSAPERPLLGVAPAAWLNVHIAISVATYALVTLAAIAALAVTLQERALRAKRPGALTDHLPSVADGERLQTRLLGAGEAILGLGLLSGMATQYLTTGALLAFDHKTLFALATFVVIGTLLLVHLRTGVGGRAAARLVLVAYLLLTLAYPGVKFVTDILAV